MNLQELRRRERQKGKKRQSREGAEQISGKLCPSFYVLEGRGRHASLLLGPAKDFAFG